MVTSEAQKRAQQKYKNKPECVPMAALDLHCALTLGAALAEIGQGDWREIAIENDCEHKFWQHNLTFY